PQVVLGHAGEGQLHTAAVGALHPDAVPGRDAQQLGGLFAEDHAAVDEGQLAAGGAAEGEVLGHLLGAVGGHQGDAEVAGALAAVVDRDGAGVEGAPALHLVPGGQGVGQAAVQVQRLVAGQGDGQVGFLDGAVLAGDDLDDGILQAEADQQQGGAAGHPQHRHIEALFIAEHIAGGGLLGKAHPAPQGADPLQEDALAGGGGPGQQEGGRLFLEGDPAGGQGGQPDHADADDHAQDGQQGIDPQPEGGQVEHGGVGPPDDGGHAGKAQRHAGGTAQQAGGGAVDHILGGDRAVGVAQGLEGAHLGAVFFHHAGHGGAGHQGRHQEEEDGEHPGDGLDAVGVLLIEHAGDDAAPVQDIPFGGGD